jgi:hypothetical protein
VYWLGRNFKPGHGLPAASLEWGGRTSPRQRLQAQGLELQYNHHLELSSWTKAGWKRFLATSTAREIFTEPCLESTELTVSGRHSTIYTGHVEGFHPCAAHGPRRLFAVVHLGGLVIAVNLDGCRDCPEPAHGSFNSLAGMKAVVRALRLRPEPTY